MPIGRLLAEANPEIEQMRALLTQEWLHPNREATEPVVIEDTGSRLNPATHLYVIWERWSRLSQTERSEIIMDAYEATHERQQVLNVTVAMGLTKEESDRLGIRYETTV